MKPVGLVDPRTGQGALRLRSASPGQPRGDALQPRRFPEPAEVGRTEAHPAAHPRARERGVLPLRHDPPEHLHQLSDGPAADVPDAKARGAVLRRTDLRRRGIHGVRGLGHHRRHQRRSARPRRSRPSLLRERRRSGLSATTSRTRKPKSYQPTNIAFGLLPPLDPPVANSKARNQAIVEQALADLEEFARETSSLKSRRAVLRFEQLAGGTWPRAARSAPSTT